MSIRRGVAFVATLAICFVTILGTPSGATPPLGAIDPSVFDVVTPSATDSEAAGAATARLVEALPTSLRESLDGTQVNYQPLLLSAAAAAAVSERVATIPNRTPSERVVVAVPGMALVADTYKTTDTVQVVVSSVPLVGMAPASAAVELAQATASSDGSVRGASGSRTMAYAMAPAAAGECENVCTESARAAGLVSLFVCTGPQALLCGAAFFVGGEVVGPACDVPAYCAAKAVQLSTACNEVDACLIEGEGAKLNARFSSGSMTLLFWRSGHRMDCFNTLSCSVDYSITTEQFHARQTDVDQFAPGGIDRIYRYDWLSFIRGGPACYVNNTRWVDVYASVYWTDGSATHKKDLDNAKYATYCQY